MGSRTLPIHISDRDMGVTASEVVVVGNGARTPLGFDVPSTAAAVRAGLCAIAEHPYMIDKEGVPMAVCVDADLPAHLQGVERYVGLARSAAVEALGPLRDADRVRPDIPVLIALPCDRPGLPPNLAPEFERRMTAVLKAHAPIGTVTCESSGHAGAFRCMEQALALLAGGRHDFCLVGGVDSYLHPDTLEWLDTTEQLHSTTTIWGFCPSEAAGFCLLGRASAARALADDVAVTLLAAGSSIEPNRIRTETVCIGVGLTDAFRATLSSVAPQSMCHTICDMNGDPYRGNEYGFAMLRCNEWFEDRADFETPADCWGDVGAASGALFAALATSAFKKGYSSGPRTFLWASSDNGLRASAALEFGRPH